MSLLLLALLLQRPADTPEATGRLPLEERHTAQLAKAVETGARQAGAEVALKSVADVKCHELRAADALIVGSPVYWSNMAGEVKSFFDRWTTECQMLPPAFPMQDKVGAAFVTGGEVSSGKEIAKLVRRGRWAPA